ncbi:hypothetical protein ACFPFV_04040 [Salinicoccus siamensis]
MPAADMNSMVRGRHECVVLFCAQSTEVQDASYCFTRNIPFSNSVFL